MAKRKNVFVDATGVRRFVDQLAAPTPDAERRTQDAPPLYRTIELVIPLADEAPGYQPMLADLRLTKRQGIIVRRLLEGLAGASAKLTNGQPPKKYEDGLKILIDMIDTAASALPAPPVHTSAPPASLNEYQGG
jgi:hypothetical protein